MLAPRKKSYDQPKQHIKKQRHYFVPTKVHLVKAMVFPVVMYGCASWSIKKAECWKLMLFNCGVGGDSWESPGQQGDPIVHPKGNQSWIFIGRTDTEAETPILWPPNAKSWLIWKDPDAGKDWRQEEKELTRIRRFVDITDSMDMSLGKLQELMMERKAWHAAVHGVTKNQTRLSYWTVLNWTCGTKK